MDPIVGGLLAQLGGNILKNIFNPGPSQAEIQAAIAAQQAAALQRNLLFGGGLVVAAILGYVLIARR